MAAIDTVTRRDNRPAASSAANGLTSFLSSSTKPDAATARASTGLKPSPSPAPVPPPSTQQRAINKGVPAWKVGDPCSGNRSLVDMAAQITAAYVANHTVSTAGTTKFIAEIHQALVALPETSESAPTRRRAWPWVLVSATALLALTTIIAGLGTGIIPRSGSDPMPVGATSMPMESVVVPEEGSVSLSTSELASAPARVIDTPEQIPIDPLTPTHFNDWEVLCAGIAETDCQLTQRSQPSSAENQAMISLRAGGQAGALSGWLTLPFTVPLDSRVTLQTGAGALDGPLSFSTCNPQGCVLPISFGDDQVEALSRGILLQANATSEDGRTVSFLFSLEGFTAAYQHILTSHEEGRSN